MIWTLQLCWDVNKGRDIPQRLHYWKSWTEPSWRRTTSKSLCWLASPCPAAFDTVDQRLLLDRPRLEFGVTETAQLAAVLPRGPNTVRQDGSAPVSRRWSPRWCPARVGARASAVRSLLQSSCRHHRSPRHRVPSIRRVMQLHLSMHADNTSSGLSFLAECSADFRQWYLQNGLQLNP